MHCRGLGTGSRGSFLVALVQTSVQSVGISRKSMTDEIRTTMFIDGHGWILLVCGCSCLRCLLLPAFCRGVPDSVTVVTNHDEVLVWAVLFEVMVPLFANVARPSPGLGVRRGRAPCHSLWRPCRMLVHWFHRVRRFALLLGCSRP